MPPPPYLTNDEIDAIRDAAIQLGLARARDTLLLGLPATFSTNLPSTGTPAELLYSDLTTMNRAEPLQDEERTIPLQRWLSTAYQLHRIRSEANVFKRMLDKIAAAKIVPPPPPPKPAETWGSSLSGPQLGELRNALLQAFPDRSSLAQMVHVGIDLRLDEVAANSNLRNAVYDLLVHANAQGLIRQLFDAARIEAPGNPELLALVPKRGA